MIDINEYIKDQLDQVYISHLVIAEIRNEIRGDIKRQINSVVRNKIDKIIAEEVEICLSSGEVNTDDGWGKKNTHASFEELFKKEFREKIDKNWDMKKAVSKGVKDKVESLFRSNIEEVKARIVQEFIKSEDTA